VGFDLAIAFDISNLAHVCFRNPELQGPAKKGLDARRHRTENQENVKVSDNICAFSLTICKSVSSSGSSSSIFRLAEQL
jgi:hypothetical protein